MRILDLLNKESLSAEERLELLDEMYWGDWNILIEEDSEKVNELLEFLRKGEFSLEEISLIQKLYSNPDGALTYEFSEIIIDLYRKDKGRFFKALALNPEESENIAYIFRNNKVFESSGKELREVLENYELTLDESSVVEIFFLNYEQLCSTWR